MKAVISIIIIVLVIAGAFSFFGLEEESQTEEVNQVETQEETQEMTEEGIEGEEEIDGEVSGEVSEEGSEEEVVSGSGYYGSYSEDKLVMAADGDVVLFFRASWCPSCRVLDQNIQDNLDEMPEDLAILTLDYDTETTLRQKYGVTIQHTLVQVDTEGNEIQKWSGGNTLDSVISKLN